MPGVGLRRLRDWTSLWLDCSRGTCSLSGLPKTVVPHLLQRFAPRQESTALPARVFGAHSGNMCFSYVGQRTDGRNFAQQDGVLATCLGAAAFLLLLHLLCHGISEPR